MYFVVNCTGDADKERRVQKSRFYGFYSCTTPLILFKPLSVETYQKFEHLYGQLPVMKRVIFHLWKQAEVSITYIHSNQLRRTGTFIVKWRWFPSHQAWWKTQKRPGVASWLIPEELPHSRAGEGSGTQKDQHLRNTEQGNDTKKTHHIRWLQFKPATLLI